MRVFPQRAQWALWALAPLFGVLATAGFAPYGHWYLGIAALAALFWLAAGLSPRRALLLGWLFGWSHFLAGVYWVYISTHVYGGAPAALGAALALLLTAYLGLYPALVLGIARRANAFEGRAGWVLVPALWLLAELLRGWVYSGFPWLSLGEMSLDTPLARLLPLIGVHGVSAVIVLVAYALFRFVTATRNAPRLVAAALALAPFLAALLPAPSSWTASSGDPVSIALVQSDIRQDEKWLPAMRYEALLRHQKLTGQAWPAEVVVWPEVALTQPLDVLKDNYLADLRQDALDHQATVLLGILVFEGEQRYNSVIATGVDQGRYDKRHLVPFGEYFPIPDFLRPLMDVLGTPYSDFTAGAARQPPMVIGGQTVALGICFEDVFGNEVRREARDAAYLLNVTNDAWFADSSAPHQHLAFSRLRAIENGRWMARVANTGISALINADGEVVARTAQFQQAVLRGTIQPRTGITPYQRWGDAPLWVLSIFALVVAARRRAPAAGKRH